MEPALQDRVRHRHDLGTRQDGKAVLGDQLLDPRIALVPVKGLRITLVPAEAAALGHGDAPHAEDLRRLIEVEHAITILVKLLDSIDLCNSA